MHMDAEKKKSGCVRDGYVLIMRTKASEERAMSGKSDRERELHEGGWGAGEKVTLTVTVTVKELQWMECWWVCYFFLLLRAVGSVLTCGVKEAAAKVENESAAAAL